MGHVPTAPLTTYHPDSSGCALLRVTDWALELKFAGPLHDQAVPSGPSPSKVHSSPWQIWSASIGLPLAIIAYLIIIYFALGIPSAFDKAKWKNGSILIADSMSYKTILERSNRSGQVKVSIENEKSGTYDEDNWPDLISRDG